MSKYVDYEWVPRGQDNPIVCPKCKSPYWNKPKTNNVGIAQLVERLAVIGE